MIREKINIQFFAPVSKPGPARSYEISEKTSIKQFVEQVGIEDIDRLLSLVNGRPKRPDTELKDGDMLSIFMLLDGG
jgi:sulfur carrier protein ThiS